MNKKGFWKKLSIKLEKHFFEFIDRMCMWFWAVLDWLQDLAKNVAHELKTHILWIVAFGFGALIYVVEKSLPIDETHHLYLSLSGAGISLSSLIRLGISILSSLLHSLGLLRSVKKLRKIILNKLNLL